MGNHSNYRPILMGAFVGATVVFGTIQFGVDSPRGIDLMTVTLAGIVLSGIPAGIVVGLRSKSREIFKDGGLSAAGGTFVGVFGWSVIAAVASPLPIAYSADIVFVTLGMTSIVFLVSFPGYFFVGGYVARAVSRLRTTSEWENVDEGIDYGKFR